MTEARTVVEEYRIRENDLEIDVIAIDLSDLYEFAPQVTACELLRTLGEAYSELGELVRASDVFVNTSPDVGVEVEGDIDKDTAYVLAWVIKEAKSKSVDEAIKFIKQFTEFDEIKVRELLKKTFRVLVLWDGYEHCYAIRLSKVIKE